MDSKNVFINRTLNMKKINYIGLDMDHTLVRYNSEAFESLAYEVMLKKLVNIKNYPEAILKSKFSYDYAIRGLVIDKARGNLLKLSRYGAIRMSRHGVNRINYSEQQKLYKSTYIDLGESNYESVDTSFSIAFAALFAQLVELKDSDPECANLPSYLEISNDLVAVLDSAHKDGSIKDVVRNNLDKYILKDESIVKGIKNFKKHGKKFFIATNSDYKYTKLLLDYAISPFLDEGETWLDLFEIVITSSQKPRFFYDNLKFLKVDPETGALYEIGSAPLEKGIYYGGCASRFTDDLKLNPDEILYVGDHIYGDILRLKKDCAWRTALVVEEIEDEINNNLEAKDVSEQINELMEQKVPIEKEIDDLISDKIENENSGNEAKIDELIKKVNELDKKISPLITKQEKSYNHYWGPLMRVGIEESYLAYQVERFACIYMDKLTNFLSYSPRTYFRSSKRIMPHDENSC